MTVAQVMPPRGLPVQDSRASLAQTNDATESQCDAGYVCFQVFIRLSHRAEDPTPSPPSFPYPLPARIHSSPNVVLRSRCIFIQDSTKQSIRAVYLKVSVCTSGPVSRKEDIRNTHLERALIFLRLALCFLIRFLRHFSRILRVSVIRSMQCAE